MQTQENVSQKGLKRSGLPGGVGYKGKLARKHCSLPIGKSAFSFNAAKTFHDFLMAYHKM